MPAEAPVPVQLAAVTWDFPLVGTTRMLAEAAPGVQAIGIDVSKEMITKAEELSSLRIRARYDAGP